MTETPRRYDVDDRINTSTRVSSAATAAGRSGGKRGTRPAFLHYVKSEKWTQVATVCGCDRSKNPETT
jgi:hypothetical protein